MITMLISGWAQPTDSLAEALPGSTGIDYMQYPSLARYYDALTPFAAEVETLVGWSLGGQIALRAIMEGRISPKRLLLVATPFQFVSSEDFPFGMPREMFDEFRQSFVENPGKTLARFGILMAKGDQNAKEIIERVTAQHYSPQPHALYWLDLLRDFSCRALDWERLPPTMIVHGEGDCVVPSAQAAAFAARLPQAKVQLWKFCGHMPQWHQPQALNELLHV